MVAFGLGEMPGTDIAAAADVIAGESELVFLPQLPERGLGSDAVGRTLALTPEFPIDARTRAWVLTPRPQRTTRRVWDRMAADLDTCQDVWPRLDALKTQVVGPWSLAASIELTSGHRAVTDSGALRDITEILCHSIARHCEDLRARFDCPIHLQIDEPLLPTLASGDLPGTSDFDVIPAIPAPDLGARLHDFSQAISGAESVRLNLANAAPVWQAARASGIEAISVSLPTIKASAQLDALGQAVSEGTRIGLCLPLQSDARVTAQRIAALWDTLGLERTLLTTAVDIHPTNSRSLLAAAAALRTARTVHGMLVRDAGDL